MCRALRFPVGVRALSWAQPLRAGRAGLGWLLRPFFLSSSGGSFGRAGGLHWVSGKRGHAFQHIRFSACRTAKGMWFHSTYIPYKCISVSGCVPRQLLMV